MSKGFLFRRLGFLAPCLLKLSNNSYIKLAHKHHISSFQDVYLNAFYWDALLKIEFEPKNIFDLGANFGLFSSLYQQIISYKGSSINPHYTFIEANKNLIEELENNIKYIIPNISYNILFGAAGPKENIRFSADKKNLLASKISRQGEEVPFIDFNLLSYPDLLKIDIEGAEELLFKNYFNWIKHAKAIIIEFHYGGANLEENIQQLKSESFELKIDRWENSGYRNQLWIKKEF